MLIKLKIILNLLLIPLEVYSVGIHTFQKDWTFQEKEVILSRDLNLRNVNAKGDNLFLYAICDEFKNSKKTCDLVLETYTPENITYKSVCRLHMETGNNNRMIVRNFILSLLGSEKVVFTWMERDMHEVSKNEVVLKISIVDFSNCDFNEIKIPIDLQGGLINDIGFNNLVTYESTFDVIFYSKSMCITGRCKVTYDSKGKRIGNVEPFPATNYTTLSWIFPVGTSFPIRRYFSFTWVFGKLSLSLVDINGEGKDLLHSEFGSYITFGASTKNETFGLCWLPLRGSSTVTCTQVDSQGNVKFNVNLNFGYKVVNVQVMNLEGGGLLLLQLACTDEECLGYKTFYLSKIHSDGHHCNKPLELPGIEVDVSSLYRYRISVYEKNEEFCMSFAGPVTISEFDITEKQPHLQFISKCFLKQYVTL